MWPIRRRRRAPPRVELPKLARGRVRMHGTHCRCAFCGFTYIYDDLPPDRLFVLRRTIAQAGSRPGRPPPLRPSAGLDPDEARIDGRPEAARHYLAG